MSGTSYVNPEQTFHNYYSSFGNTLNWASWLSFAAGLGVLFGPIVAQLFRDTNVSN